MASRGDSQCILDEKDLPAKVFDEKWKTDIKFIEFSDSINLNRKIDDMEKWIKNFDSKIFATYNNNTFGGLKHIQDKRCRDLNYYINYVLYYIPEITNDKENITEIVERFKIFVRAIFNSWGIINSQAKFKCTRMHKDYTHKMILIKELDDYCENKKSFQEKLQTYNYITCCKYANHVNATKSSFNNYILNGNVNKDDRDFHIDDKCTLKNSGETFPNVICNENDMSVSKSDELPVTPLNGHLATSQQHMLLETLPVGTFNSSPTKIALTSVSTLLGACVSGLYLYRHSFVGSMLRNFQNRNRISNEDTYDDVNGMFSEGTSHYLDNLQENNRFHIAYDPMNN
ncbi:PIR Superfamily Protein [Plasmodium ovale curtisi]|uniref:PIR Superfamily Protein n=1 Tax=Plasmodium ovale curtisi TaxID=864141 RepID=A0A1A8WD53_PLAOA|nr:PIR Superfamily Protein [Plasmodium ovale curtisi]